MAIPPISAAGIGAGAAGPVGGVGATEKAGPGFGEVIKKGLQEVSAAENGVDSLTEKLATGQDVQIHELMIATQKASLSVDLLNQVRNRAVEAYQEVMRLQV